MKKFDKGYFYYSLISSVFSAAIICCFLIGNFLPDDFELKDEFVLPVILIGLAVYSVIYLALVIHRYLFVKTSGYELTKDEIRCKFGVFFKKSSVLTYSKIHAVNKRQGLIQRIFNIAVLTVDSGATSNAFKAEITIYEKSEVVDELIKTIKAAQQGEVVLPKTEEKATQNLYSFNSKLKTIYSLLTVSASLLFVFVLIFLGAVGIFVASFFLKQVNDIIITSLVISVFALLIISIISAIGGIITSFVAYHGFTITKNKTDIEISYGLLVRHTNTFKLSRIKAIKVNEGPIKRLFGFVSVGLEVVGYGVENSNQNDSQSASNGILIPLCRKKDLNAILSKILPNYFPEETETKAKSYPSFVMWPCFTITISFAVVLLVTQTILSVLSVSLNIMGIVALWFLYTYFLVIIISLFIGFLSFKNTGLTVSADKVTARNGSIVKITTVIRKKDLIAIENITTPCRKKRNIYSFKIHFFTNALTNTVTVKNINGDCNENLKKILRF